MFRLGRDGKSFLFQKHEENSHNQATEGDNMVPLNGLTLEDKRGDDCEHGQRNHFLNHLKLQKIEGAAVPLETNPVGRYRKTVLEESDSPRKENDENKRRGVSKKARLLELEMTVPRKRHEHIRKDEHDDSPDSLPSFILVYFYCKKSTTNFCDAKIGVFVLLSVCFFKKTSA